MPGGQPASDPVEVAIVEDLRDVREGLAFLINSTEGYRCTRVFESMEECLERIGPHPPDVALVDLGLPGMTGIEGIRALKERFPDLRAVVLTVYKDDDRIFSAICAGACGYLLKKTPPARLIESLRDVAAGGAPMSPEVAQRVMELFRRFHAPAEEYRLTAQELHLLKLLGQGHAFKTAAAEMGLSIHTIDFHVRRIYEKLQVHSKSEAVAKAIREGLIC